MAVTPVQNGLYRGTTNGITYYTTLPNYNVSSQLTQVTNPQEVKDYITHLNSLGAYTPGSSTGVQFDAQGVAKQAQAALDQFTSQPNSGYVLDQNGNFTTQQAIDSVNAGNAAVAAGTQRNIGTAEAPLYVPTGSAGDTLNQGITNGTVSKQDPNAQMNASMQGNNVGQLSPIRPPTNSSVTAPGPVNPQTPQGTGMTASASSTTPARPPSNQFSSFVKTPNDNTVYGVGSNGSYTPFSTPQDFFNAGGAQDFSNVQTVNSLPQNANVAAPFQAGSSSAGGTAGATGTTTGSTLPDYNTLLGQIATLQQPTPDEKSVQDQIDALTTSEKMGINQINAEPIPYSEKSGIAKNIQDQANTQIETLTQKLARLQAQRSAALDAASTELGAVAPKALPLGTSLVFPTTGQQIGGISSSDQQLLANAISAGHLQPTVITRSPEEIQAIINTLKQNPGFDFTGQTANAQGQIAAATAQSQLKFDPQSGTFVNFQPTVPGAVNNTTTPIGSGSTGGGQFSSFVRKAGSPTIYGIDANGTATPFSSPAQFFAAGGAKDFSNVKVIGGSGTNSAGSTSSPTSAPASSSTSVQSASPVANFNYGPYTPSDIQGAAEIYMTTGSFPSGTPVKKQSILQQYADKLIGGTFNAAKVQALNSADKSALDTQIGYLNTTQRSIQNAEAGFKQVLSAFPGLNSNQSPLWNQTANNLAKSLTGGQRNAFLAGLTEIGNEYSQVFSRGGANTVSSHVSASDVVNGNLSMTDLKGVLDELQAQGKVVINGARNQVNSILNNFGNSTMQGGSTNSTSINQAPASNFQFAF